MYKLIIADDEPIILSGITHLLDWKSEECEITGCCRNGKEAYDLISNTLPDIVITDIKMPIMDGLELIRKCYSDFPQVVFIILSSLEEFKLVKEAIKYNIIDYLIKTELDAPLLSSTIKKAIEERNRRKRLSGASVGGTSAYDNTDEIISNLFVMRRIPEKSFLKESAMGLFTSYVFVSFLFSFPSSSLETNWNVGDWERLYSWQGDVIRKIISSIFPEVKAVNPVCLKMSRYIFLIPKVSPETWNVQLSRLREKVKRASDMVTKLEVEVISSSVHKGFEEVADARNEIEYGFSSYYLDTAKPVLGSLELDDVFPKLESAIRGKDIAAVNAVFKRLSDTMEAIDHKPSQATFVLSAVRSALHSGLSALGMLDDGVMEELFSTVNFLSKRSMILLLLSDIQSYIQETLSSISGSSSSPFIDKAREYVLIHVKERISLSDVASYAGVSPGYLSKSFKKIMEMSLVDYINQAKCEKAKELMKKGSSRVNEIAIELGFENIYYFSKVFKKVTGLSPTEYQKN